MGRNKANEQFTTGFKVYEPKPAVTIPRPEG